MRLEVSASATLSLSGRRSNLGDPTHVRALLKTGRYYVKTAPECAARNRSGPMAPISKGVEKMPAGRPRSSRSRFVLRIQSESAPRR
jgi:hypothetical protein